MKFKALLMSGIIASLLFFFNLNSCLGYSNSADCLDIVAGREAVVVEAAEVTTDGGISGDTEKKNPVRIFVEGTLVETRYYSYGEKLVLSNYMYNGFMVEAWSYDSFVMNANGAVIKHEQKNVNKNSLEVLIVGRVDIYGTIFLIKTDDRIYMETLVHYWEERGYPTYVGGAYMNGSKWTIYLSENTSERQGEIRRQIYEWENPIFVSCVYSRQELVNTKDAIMEKYGMDFGIRSISIACHQWQDGVTEPRVLVVMEGLKNYDSFAEKFYSKYGNKVVVGVYDAISGVTYPAHAPEKVTVKSAKVKKKKLVIKWSEAEGASKYQIQIFRGKKKIKTVCVKKLSYKYSLKKKKAGKYYVKVRAYGKEAKRWGNWSKKTKAK